MSRPGRPVRFCWIVAGSFSSPSSRATSSIRSASRVTSLRRQCGTLTSRPSSAVADAEAERIEDLGAVAHAQPASRAVRRRARRAAGSSRPAARASPTSTVPRNEPWRRSARASAALRRPAPRARLSGGSPFSKRAEASLRRPDPRRRAVDVRPVPGRSLEQHAGRAVLDLRAQAAHHAGDRGRHRRRRRSHIRRRPACAPARRASSSSRRRAPRRTTSRPPATRSRSKACSG